jgi:hypothetical protein
MTDPQQQALPPPDIRVTDFGEVEATNRRTFVMGDFYTADQMRAYAAEAVADALASLQADFDAYKEGSEEAFGAVVEQKRQALERLQQIEQTIATQQSVIARLRAGSRPSA